MKPKLLDVIQQGLQWFQIKTKSCADYLESMKNKNVSREQKILARLKYDQAQSQKLAH